MSLHGVLPADVDPIRVHVLRLRVEGKTYAQIAAEVGVHVATVSKYLRDEFDRVTAEKDAIWREYVTLHLERTEWLIRRLVAPYAADESLKMDHKDATAAKALLERQAKLLGLDAPQKAEQTISFAAMPDSQLAEELRRNGIDDVLE